MTKWLARFVWCVLCVMAAALATLPVVWAQAAYPQRLDSFVNDYANLLLAQDAAAVRTSLADLKAAHGIEAVVVTINLIDDYDTGDTTIESFATGLFNSWGIGDARKNNGVLLLVAVKDHKVRVELGSGYGSGHSSEMQAVIDRYILPKFRQNDYSAGIAIGTQAMIAKLTDRPMPELMEPTSAPLPVFTPNYTNSVPSTLQSSEAVIGAIVVGVGVAVTLVLVAAKGGMSGSGGSWESSSNDSTSNWNNASSYISSSDSSSSSSDTSSSSGGSSSGGGATGSW